MTGMPPKEAKATGSLGFRSVKDVPVGMSEAEVRVDLAACYRLVALYGMTDLAANHITARVPGRHEHFFINAYGMLYEEVTASSLYKIDLEGNVVEKPAVPYGINPAGYVIHSAIHAARPDVVCVLHTHTQAGTAVSCLKEGLLALSQTAMTLAHDVAYHDFEGIVTSDAERASLVRDLGNRNSLILRNHGLLTCGRSVAEAFFRMHRLESACRIQIAATSTGREIQLPSDQAQQAVGKLMKNLSDVPRGHLEWHALRRRVDRLLPGYEA